MHPGGSCNPSPSVTAPPSPTPVDEIAAAIEHIVALQGLPYEDRLWLARNGTEMIANPGDILFEEGAPAEHMVLILKGEIHVRRQHGGPMALFIGRTGQMTGILPFSRMKSYGGQGFAITPVWTLLIPRSLFPQMLQAIPSMAQRVVSTMLDRVREVTRMSSRLRNWPRLASWQATWPMSSTIRHLPPSAPRPAWSPLCAPIAPTASSS